MAAELACMAEKGYFATLGVTFRADEQAVSKAYKRLALKLHPDKCPGPTAVDDFQKITTSYHVILDLDKRSCYMRLFLLRCYMSQVRPEENGPLRPFYAFMIEKKGSMGSKSDRLITIDLLDRKLHAYKKDALQKEIPISAVAGVSTSDSASGSKALDLTVTFKGKEEPWSVRCRCAEQFETLAIVLRRIVAAAASDFSDEALNLIMDDASSPPSSVHKSKVMKRADKGGTLMNDWQPRFMVMGTTQLLIFRDVELQQMVNIIPLSLLTLSRDRRDPATFQLATSWWKAGFISASEATTNKWQECLDECVAAMPPPPPSPARPGSSSGGSSPSATPPPQAAAPRKAVRPNRPSVVFTDRDLANMHVANSYRTPLSPSIPEVPTADNAYGRVPPPPPELAAADAMLPGGWRQYSDGNGTSYYYHALTNQTVWELPEGTAASGSPLGESTFSARMESDDVRSAQLAALREAEGAGAVPSALMLSEAKGSLLKMMQEMERGLSRCKRGVETDKALHDLAPMFEQLRATFDELSTRGADYEQKWLRRGEDKQTFMKDKGDYLQGLQTHMLGDDTDQNAESVAGKLFRECAYVADTYHPKAGPVRTMV